MLILPCFACVEGQALTGEPGGLKISGEPLVLKMRGEVEIVFLSKEEF